MTAIGIIAKVHKDGEKVVDVTIPYELEFRPTHHFSNLKEFDQDGNQVKWHDQLKRIKKGEVLFNVHAWTAPNEPGFDGRFVKIAEVKLKTDLYTSEFGDERLFFKHTNIKNDMVEHWPRDW